MACATVPSAAAPPPTAKPEEPTTVGVAKVVIIELDPDVASGIVAEPASAVSKPIPL